MIIDWCFIAVSWVQDGMSEGLIASSGVLMGTTSKLSSWARRSMLCKRSLFTKFAVIVYVKLSYLCLFDDRGIPLTTTYVTVKYEDHQYADARKALLKHWPNWLVASNVDEFDLQPRENESLHVKK